MKKILIATTALVATAGFASAEVTGSGPGTINITGSAEVGIFGGSGDSNLRDIDTQFHTDIDITFAMTGEADNGLTFGATVDLDENGAFAPESHGGATYFLAYGNARLDAGDTDGAFDAALQEVALAGGSIQDDETTHAGYNGNGDNFNSDGQVARFSYTFNSFTAHVSVVQGDTITVDDATTPLVNEQRSIEDKDAVYGIGFRYSGDLGGLTLGVGLGYQTQSDVADMWGISVDTTFANGIKAAVNYSQKDPNGANNTVTHWGIGFGYTMNNLAIGVNYGSYDSDVAGADATGFGLAASYDLGGGLSAKAGYGSSNPEGGSNDYNTFSLGLAMSF